MGAPAALQHTCWSPVDGAPRTGGHEQPAARVTPIRAPVAPGAQHFAPSLTAGRGNAATTRVTAGSLTAAQECLAGRL